MSKASVQHSLNNARTYLYGASGDIATRMDRCKVVLDLTGCTERAWIWRPRGGPFVVKYVSRVREGVMLEYVLYQSRVAICGYSS